MIVSSQTYNTSDPTVDSQVVSLKASGADVFLHLLACRNSRRRPSARPIDIDWHPQEFVSSVGSSIAGAIKPAGFEAAKGIISAAYQKDPADPQWHDDPAMKAWNVWMDKYNPRIDKSDYYAPYGYNIGYAVVAAAQAVRRQSDAREHHEAGIPSATWNLPLLLPGIRLNDHADRPAADQADAAGARSTASATCCSAT